MVIWSRLEASCPLCNHRLPLREVGGGFVLGQDSDLLVRMEGAHVIQADIHTCKRCRFSGYSDDFLRSLSDDEKESCRRILARFLAEDLDLPSTARGRGNHRKLSPDVQYLWAARTAAELGAPATRQGLLLTRAYWCTRLAPTDRLEPRILERRQRDYLKQAIQKLRQGLRSEKDPNLLYLIGELCRRNRNFLLAESYFRRFLAQEETAEYLRKAARKLLAQARQKSSTPHTMEGLLYGTPSRAKRRGPKKKP